MKGYELYSWQVDGEWYFSLLIGTDRLKTIDEITSSEVTIRGVEALKQQLSRLPKGEQVFWVADRVPGTNIPGNEITDQVKHFCEQLGLQIWVPGS